MIPNRDKEREYLLNKTDKESNLSDKECNILVNKIDLDKGGNETLEFKKGFFTDDLKEAFEKITERIDNAQKDFANLEIIDKEEALQIIKEEMGEKVIWEF